MQDSDHGITDAGLVPDSTLQQKVNDPTAAARLHENHSTTAQFHTREPPARPLWRRVVNAAIASRRFAHRNSINDDSNQQLNDQNWRPQIRLHQVSV